MGDVTAASTRDLLHHRPKPNLMKKLTSLLHPKKSKPSKSASSSAHVPPSAPPQAATAGAGSELELLFAQAEATLGELLVRAGARSYSLTDHHHHPPLPTANAVADDVSPVISSCSRSAKFSEQPAHERRRSLSRVWQRFGGSLFCGSGHMNAYVMDQDMMMAPAPARDFYDDVVLDEAYWQSLADAILLQQRHQKAEDTKEGGAYGLSCPFNKEVESDQQHLAAGVQHTDHVQEEDRESEIVASMDGDSMSNKPWAVCGSASSTESVSLQHISSCRRLNTTLDESPNLAHNYNHLKAAAAAASTSNSSSCAEVTDEIVSSSMQPLERFLKQAARTSASASSRSAPELFTCTQEPAGGELPGTTSCRVSLLTLLHEETAAADSASPLGGRQEEEEEAEAAAAPAPPPEAADEEGQRARSMRVQVGEDLLQCCVCMVRRKGAALIPCGHTFCRTCAKQLFAGRGACPLCNNLIVQVLDIF